MRLVRDNGNDQGKLAKFECLLDGEMSEEAIDGTFIGVENFGGVGGMWEGFDDGGVPVEGRGEKRRVVGFRDVDDEVVRRIRFR
ncbi:hypothetical protein SLA2020_124110 [Shorea laevis]